MDLWSQLTSNPWPVLRALLAVVLLIHFFAGAALFYIWLERKVCGRMQDRLGPTRVGGKFGWLQTLADGVKLIAKEDFIPAAADHFLFRISVYIAFCGSFAAFIALPFGKDVVGVEMNIAVFFMLAVMSSEVFGIILAGYGSGSKWSLFGGMREAAQMVSYEVPLAICVVIPVLVAGTMNLNLIGQQQSGWFWNWYLLHDPFLFLTFWVYFTCAMAECKRAPFDLSEAESELVGGFHTEFSGLRWSFFYMAEYGSMFAVSGIATTLFLGGWYTGTGLEPWLESAFGFGVFPAAADASAGAWTMYLLGKICNVSVFIIKSWLLVFVMMWVRWTLPRLRIDQVMMTCLKYLLPMSCVLLLGASLMPLLWPSWLRWGRAAGYPAISKPAPAGDREALRTGPTAHSGSRADVPMGGR